MLLALAILPVGQGYEVGMSPSVLQMDSGGHGYLTVINPNLFRIAYTLNSTAALSRTEGIIEPENSVRIGVNSATEALIVASFGPGLEEQPLGISAQLRVRIQPYRVPVATGISVLAGVVIVLLLLFGLIYARLQAYGS
ncbi:MAG TPA: hypothetical protein VJH22_05870 [Candidatus Nanoarchaeia archaeon]|nr:hypothetical protein [Candidatus Nanoarchaeia archaeon]